MTLLLALGVFCSAQLGVLLGMVGGSASGDDGLGRRGRGDDAGGRLAGGTRHPRQAVGLHPRTATQ